MNVPDDLRYSADHEWARLEVGKVRVGITDFAQENLGDLVFIGEAELGSTISAHDVICEIDSSKSANEIYAPVGGTISEVNPDLAEHPELVNDDPYGEGWLVTIDVIDESEFGALLDADAYRALISD